MRQAAHKKGCACHLPRKDKKKTWHILRQCPNLCGSLQEEKARGVNLTRYRAAEADSTRAGGNWEGRRYVPVVEPKNNDRVFVFKNVGQKVAEFMWIDCTWMSSLPCPIFSVIGTLFDMKCGACFRVTCKMWNLGSYNVRSEWRSPDHTLSY